MSLLATISLAFALAMDAFAASIAAGARLGRVSGRQIFRLAFHFGLFQAAMPVLGWLAGSTIARWIETWDHWVAFGLLAFVGGRSVLSALRGEGLAADGAQKDPTRGATLVMLAVATSIDALAVGIGMAALKVDILLPVLLIGLVAGGMTVVGLLFGARLGRRFGRWMEAAGGLVLVGIGVKILTEHLLAA